MLNSKAKKIFFLLSLGCLLSRSAHAAIISAKPATTPKASPTVFSVMKSTYSDSARPLVPAKIIAVEAKAPLLLPTLVGPLHPWGYQAPAANSPQVKMQPTPVMNKNIFQIR